MTGKTFEMGAVGQWGIRGIVRGYYAVAHVPLPPAGITGTIEERRAERDAMAQRIVDALNATESHKINEDET